MSDNDFSNDSMLELYLFEATGLLDQLDDILLQSESDNSLTSENINEIFRIMHTIKGSSAMMSFNLISMVAHKVEDLFSLIRDNGVPEDKFEALFDLVLKVSDFLKDEIKKIQEGKEVETENNTLENEIQSMLDNFMTLSPPTKSKVDLGRTLGGNSDADSQSPASKQELQISSSTPNVKETEEISKPVEVENKESFIDRPIESPNVETEQIQEPEASLPDNNISNDASDNKNEEEKTNTFYLHVYFNEGSKMENIRAFMLINKLKEVGTVNESLPSDLENNADSANYIIENGFCISFTTVLSREEIENITKGTLSVESVSFMKKMPDASGSSVFIKESSDEQEIEAVDTDNHEEEIIQDESEISEITAEAEDKTDETEITGKVAKEKPVQDHRIPKPTKQNLINVDLTKLDGLMDLVGELVITESMVTENLDLQGLKLDNFRKSARQLNKLTDELQDIVMSVRLVPISSVFQRMRRIVRDMNKDLNKDVELVLIGENTEVDKTILNALGDPIMHLVRNAMDHAIESKEQREKAGKNSTGSIILSAQNMGGDIIISVSDDGKGLDPKELLEKAKEKNLLTKPESEYTDKEIFNLMTMPGFSTKEEVTEYSGRGVGMDVVKMNIKNIGGSVIIESVKGLGTNIFLKIPITLAIIPCMELRVGDDIYCLPISNIKESFKPSAGQLIKDPDDNEMIMLRGTVYPIIRLHKLYNIAEAEKNLDDSILILVDSGDKMACLMTDELIGKSQVVVKPIPAYLGEFNVKKTGVSGCTIMGDGSISLILDVMEILS